jgi:hypothetical protein
MELNYYAHIMTRFLSSFVQFESFDLTAGLEPRSKVYVLKPCCREDLQY